MQATGYCLSVYRSEVADMVIGVAAKLTGAKYNRGKKPKTQRSNSKKKTYIDYNDPADVARAEARDAAIFAQAVQRPEVTLKW